MGEGKREREGVGREGGDDKSTKKIKHEKISLPH